MVTMRGFFRTLSDFSTGLVVFQWYEDVCFMSRGVGSPKLCFTFGNLYS